MEKTIIKTSKAPAAIGPYSQGLKAGPSSASGAKAFTLCSY